MISTQVQKPLIPTQWYEILKFKKVEVIAQLTARSISHNITTHIMTLKSKLYKAIKQGVKSLTSQFNALIGDDWTEALQESGKTFKQFKKDLLRKFHPDLHGGSQEATQISQTINEWEEPVKAWSNLIDNAHESEKEIYEEFARAWEYVMHPDTRWKVAQEYGWTDRAKWDAFQQEQKEAMAAAGWC